MRKPRIAEEDEDWGVRRPNFSEKPSTSGKGKWIIVGVGSITVLYAFLYIFTKNMSSHSNFLMESNFIPNSPQSQTKGSIAVIENLPVPSDGKQNCENIWTNEKLIGRCFGLTPHSKFPQLKNIEVVNSPNECKSLCCNLGEQCYTWQYWVENKVCNLGPRIRFGNEEVDSKTDGSTYWCEPEAPVVWRGRRIQSRDGKKCEWGDSLPTQCHGLGGEKRGKITCYFTYMVFYLLVSVTNLHDILYLNNTQEMTVID